MDEELKQIRLALFARRNGVVADALKAAGDSHQLIMGCPLSDIIAVAQEHQKSAELAEALWADTKHRECRLIATMLYPAGVCDKATAYRWCREVLTEEEADVLCHRLLRQLEYAPDLMCELLNESDTMMRYIAFRLMLNLTLAQRLEMTNALRQQVTTEAEHPCSPAMMQVLNGLLDD